MYDGARIAVPAELAAKARGAAQIKFGVRPENVTLSAQHGDDITVPAEAIQAARFSAWPNSSQPSSAISPVPTPDQIA